MSATNSILSVYVQLGLIKEGKRTFAFGSNRVDYQTQGVMSGKSDTYELAADESRVVYEREADDEREIPCIAVFSSGFDVYAEILTDTAPATNEQSVILEVPYGKPLIIAGWRTLTALTGGTPGLVRSVTVKNLNADSEDRTVQVVTIEGQVPVTE